jgi:hypothetical protein
MNAGNWSSRSHDDGAAHNFASTIADNLTRLLNDALAEHDPTVSASGVELGDFERISIILRSYYWCRRRARPGAPEVVAHKSKSNGGAGTSRGSDAVGEYEALHPERNRRKTT